MQTLHLKWHCSSPNLATIRVVIWLLEKKEKNGKHLRGLKPRDECGNVERLFLFFPVFQLTVVSVCFLELIQGDRESQCGEL